MKKAAIIFVAFIACVNSMTLQEQRQMMVGAAQECKAISGANDNDLSLLILKKPLVTKEGKCLLACIMESVGILEGLTLNKDNFIEHITISAKGDAGIIKKLSEMANICVKITDADQCEIAVKAIACIKKEMADAKMKIDIGV